MIRESCRATVQVKNLRCSYREQQGLALAIDSLELFEGQMHFILGRSGIGKSTLIEALGLMEETVEPNADCSIIYELQNERRDFFSLWEEGESALSHFRQEHFSFIFQSTNLLPNLTLEENVMMPAWIAKIEGLEEKLQGLFERLLPEIPCHDWDKDVTEVSGGQRQRLAFMRALIKPFDILFGDEPTGNLDSWKANQAIALLVAELKKQKGMACIVSHDISLATKYADIIYLLTPSDGDSSESHGELKSVNCFERASKGWLNFDGKLIEDNELESHLHKALQAS